MVETRNRRKSAAPAARGTAAAGAGASLVAAAAPPAAGSSLEASPAAAVPSTTGRQATAATADAGGQVDYAEMYRQAAQRRKQQEQANPVRRLIGRVKLFYHRQSITWAWYMLETWEVVLWMSVLLLITYFVLSACFVNPSSICRSTLVALRNSLAARGAKLLSYTR